MIKRALVSVFDKRNIVGLSQFLVNKDVTIYSTGGTYSKLIKEIDQKDKVHEISSLTQFPEILDGRVKTLHPMIHGGLLAKKDNVQHMEELNKLGIEPFDMVIVNLYPFEQVVKSGADEETILENIDIGGHTLIRAASKNYKHVLVLTDPNDYELIQEKWDRLDELKQYLAKKAFSHVANYDMAISSYFNPENIYRTYVQEDRLKYGSNPQQKFAGVYKNGTNDTNSIQVINGKPGYINYLDAIYGFSLVCELKDALNMPSVASYKHNSPAGVGVSVELTDVLKEVYFVGHKKLSPIATAYVRARNVDPMCSFGDFLAFSDPVDVVTANLISSEVSDGIIAPDYEPEALDILKKKKKGSYVILQGDPTKIHSNLGDLEIRELHGMVLVQEENRAVTTFKNFANSNISSEDKINLILANTVLKYTQSNSVASAKDGQVLGVGAGQQSRVDCVKLVKRKTEYWYLRQHPKCLSLLTKFKHGTKRTDKINAIVQYIEGDMTKEWYDLFDTEVEPLTKEEKETFLGTLDNVSLASDAFFPFRDNIDIANQFGVKYIIQPGGSVADDEIVKACHQYGMQMCMTGPNMRMFLH